jgi:hypothetical protein
MNLNIKFVLFCFLIKTSADAEEGLNNLFLKKSNLNNLYIGVIKPLTFNEIEIEKFKNFNLYFKNFDIQFGIIDCEFLANFRSEYEKYFKNQYCTQEILTTDEDKIFIFKFYLIIFNIMIAIT